MAAQQKIKTVRIALADIAIPDRLRNLDQSRVDLIVESAGDATGIRDAIHVRKVSNGYELIDGRHRLAACEAFGSLDVEASIWKCTAEQARLVEADANVLSGGFITPLDLAVSLAARKRAYETLHPETKRGVAGALARHGQQGTEMSFADYLAAVMGKTPRQVRRVISAGEKLDPRDVAILRQAPKPLAMNDIYELAKIDNTVERYDVVEAIGAGKAKTVSKARKLYAAEQGTAPGPVDPVDAEYQALLKAWQRARKSARRRFLDRIGDDLLEMQEGGDV